MFYTENLLRNEFFPSELPECFNTNDLADNGEDIINSTTSYGQRYSIPLKYNGYKTETSRRKFAIPNPYHYCKAVDVIVRNEAEIFKVLTKSRYSLTAPINKHPQKGQAFVKKSATVADTKRAIEMQYQNNRYEIRLDISSFFDSIYTHSIPWAIHGIDVSKHRKNDKSLLGNILDSHIRAMNYEQTNGILVGNAVSRIISEIILCTIDDQIQQKFPHISCCRFVDDYYIYTDSVSQIQEIISFVRTQLAQYELSFNENKIQINESPFLYGKTWVEQIKQYIHLQPDVFLSKLIMEYNRYKDIAIIKYGLKIIEECKYNSQTWPVMQSRLINLWVRFPSLASRILPMFWKNKNFLNKTSLKKAIYTVIDESILLNRNLELVWAVWFVKIFEIKISQPYIVKVLESKNDVAVIIMLDIISQNGMSHKNMIKRQMIELRDFLEEKNSEDGKTNLVMWSEHWLLAYEADLNKWLKIDGKPFELARKTPFFTHLISKKIKFYDPAFTYGESTTTTRSYEYATRRELYATINKLKLSLNEHFKELGDGKTLEWNETEKTLYEKILDIWSENEMIYAG